VSCESGSFVDYGEIDATINTTLWNYGATISTPGEFVIATAAVPEPSTLALAAFGLGFLCLMVIRRRGAVQKC
jgi:hypothetical protein